MTCDARGAAQAEGLRRKGGGEGKKGDEGRRERNRVSQLTWESILPASATVAAAASTVFKLLNLQQQFRLPPDRSPLATLPLPLLLVTHVYASFMHSSIS